MVPVLSEVMRLRNTDSSSRPGQCTLQEKQLWLYDKNMQGNDISLSFANLRNKNTLLSFFLLNAAFFGYYIYPGLISTQTSTWQAYSIST